MKKRIIMGLLAAMTVVSLSACGGSEEAATTAAATTAAATTAAATTEAPTTEAPTTEAEVEEEVEVELEVADASEALAGTLWLDEEDTVYDFYDDGATVGFTFPDGTEAIGEYAFAVNEEGYMVLGFDIPDYGVEAIWIVTDYTDEYFEFADIETGAVTYFYPAEVVEEEPEIAVADASAALAESVWADEDGTIFGFNVDGSSLMAVLPDGTEVYGEYALAVAEDYTTVLGFSIPDLGVEIMWVMTDITEEYLEFTDLESGELTYLYPVEMEEAAAEEEAVEVDVFAELVTYGWYDDEEVYYEFDADGYTLYVVLPDETEVYGEYELGEDESGATLLAISLPDLGAEFIWGLSGITEDSFEFTDLDSGTVTSLYPEVE